MIACNENSIAHVSSLPLFLNINLRVEREQIGLIIMHLHEVQRLRKIKDERVTLTSDVQVGVDATPLRFC